MPELSRFNGIVIYMQFYDTKHHNKPHVHVYYGDYEASVGIDGELMAGRGAADALVRAADFCDRCVRKTAARGEAHWYGLAFEDVLKEERSL